MNNLPKRRCCNCTHKNPPNNYCWSLNELIENPDNDYCNNHNYNFETKLVKVVTQEELMKQFLYQLPPVYDTSYTYVGNEKVFCNSQTKKKFYEWMSCALTFGILKGEK